MNMSDYIEKYLEDEKKFEEAYELRPDISQEEKYNLNYERSRDALDGGDLVTDEE